MPTAFVLAREMRFTNVPLKSTKRGFAIPRPPVLRSKALTGKEDPKDKEWDGRAASFSWTPQRLYVGEMTYKPVGKAGFTKTITSCQEVTPAIWNQAMGEWQQYLRDNAEDFTSTHNNVTRGMVNRSLISRATHAPSVPTATSTNVPSPIPTPVITLPQNGPLPIMTWDPNDLDIADDLFDVPQDNPNFLPDKETFDLLDTTWKLICTTGEPKQVLIYGDTSTGKTEHPQIWCARNDVLWCRIDCGAFGEIYDVTGPIKAVERNGVSVTEWVHGKTIRALADPRPAVIQLDEVNRISDVKAMNVLFPFLDSAKQSYFDDAKTWMKLNGVKLIIATMNGDTRGDDIGEYVGTQPLDQAFISRFPIRRQLRYPDAQKLAQILEARNAGQLSQATIQQLAEIAQELVALNKFVPNLRELFAALDFLKAGIDMFYALKWTLGGVYKNDGTPACDWITFRGILLGKNIDIHEN